MRYYRIILKFTLPIFWGIAIISPNSGCLRNHVSIECPPGTRPVGNAPPLGNREYCVGAEHEQTGPWRFHFPNGILQSQGYYVAGKKNGTFSKWNSVGVKVSEGVYYQDRKIGIWREWTSQGHLLSKTPYVDGEIHGHRYFFFENGNKSAQFYYIRGLPIRDHQRLFLRPGQPHKKAD